MKLPGGGGGLMIMKIVMRVAAVQTDSNARESTSCGNNNFANFANFSANHKLLEIKLRIFLNAAFNQLELKG